MTPLYTTHESQIMKNRARVTLLAALAFLCGGMILCVSLCGQVRTGNEKQMFLRVVTAFTLAGWCAILLLRLGYAPARAECRHALHLAAGEAKEYQGVIRVSPQAFKIPRSIYVQKAVLQQEDDAVTLHVNARLAHRLPPDGTSIRVQTVKQFITAYEVCDE